ncbi:DUF4873 domain-containing protein [Pseudonocardia abyssalis]|uniref:DUF4873 domain-containing protein n=1 Tax=Pseudonocardia abyssalis TaxID=2792008 RepID=A0ABS6UVW6_9PSEU|nr:DUF4873 domain-containing protein [Pseudonocardia abyssalis]MBW0118926.1 DUF4873 domain-containing protein [Pseudonocardia abyssalis]MBW0136402.1 DUF4873 domain-containing protein [Pseudonocardia abyssalis]
MTDDEHEDGYRGPATLTVDGRDVPVRVVLGARHEPHDGRLHWFGRLSLERDVEPALLGALTAASSRLELRTDGGRADARIGDQDPWGRYRVTGVGRLPYAVEEPALDDD